MRFGTSGTTRSGRRRPLAWVTTAALALSVGLLGATGAAAGTEGHSAAGAHQARTYAVRTHGRTVHVTPHGRFGVAKQHSAAVTRHGDDHGANAPAAASSGLQYGGGPVQHSAQVYLIFWGSQWDSDSNGVQQYVTDLFNGLGTSSDTWSTVTSQYTDDTGGGPTFNGAVLAGVWVDDAGAAPDSAAQADIAGEAEAGVSHFGISPSSDDQMVVLSPSGTHPDNFPNGGWCAWHDYDGTVPYTNMPYVLDAGSTCGAGSVAGQLDGFSIVEGHEYAETLTDPQPSSGWVDPGGQENGDLCAWQNLGTINLSSGTFAMQPTWSNAIGGCAMSG